MNILVIAPHPDDEVLGCGGTIARLSQEGHHINILILTKGMPPLFSAKEVASGRTHALKAHKLLGVKDTIFCDFPAAALDTVPHMEINDVLTKHIHQMNPDMMFVPFRTDLHLDHQHTFVSSLVAARPNRVNYPKKIYAYETLSETNWNAPYLTSGFHPNAFFDITPFLAIKLDAFKMYLHQVKEFPHERSIEALRALATLRGSTIHRDAAEAFVMIREIS